MLIGVISDTHGLLRPEALERLGGVKHIVHAGDVSRPDILEPLGRIAPTTAIRGNVDEGAWAAGLPDQTTLRLAGHVIHVLHNLKRLDFDPAERGVGIVISGHTHQPASDWRNGVLFLNPGSAGRRRFRLPVTLATLALSDTPRPVIHHLLP